MKKIILFSVISATDWTNINARDIGQWAALIQQSGSGTRR